MTATKPDLAHLRINRDDPPPSRSGSSRGPWIGVAALLVIAVSTPV
jgi:hypothetical protein